MWTQGVLGDRVSAFDPDHTGQDRERGEGEPVGGNDAQEAALRVVSQRRLGWPAASRGDERAIEEEARDDEEDHHAEIEMDDQALEQARQCLRARNVDQDHAEHRDRAQTVEEREARMAWRRGDRVGHRPRLRPEPGSAMRSPLFAAAPSSASDVDSDPLGDPGDQPGQGAGALAALQRRLLAQDRAADDPPADVAERLGRDPERLAARRRRARPARRDARAPARRASGRPCATGRRRDRCSRSRRGFDRRSRPRPGGGSARRRPARPRRARSAGPPGPGRSAPGGARPRRSPRGRSPPDRRCGRRGRRRRHPIRTRSCRRGWCGSSGPSPERR